MFEDFGTFLLWVFCTWALANFVLGYIEGYSSQRQEIELEIRKVVNDIVHRVKKETHGDMIYWFDHDDNEFLAQGKTTEEIVAVLKQRFKDHIFVLEDKYLLAGPDFEMLDLTEENLQNIKI